MYMHALHALFCILFSCTAFSMQNYKVISNVKFVSLDSFHKVLETSSLMECAMFGSSNLYFSVEFNNQTKTCIPSKCFRNTIKSIGTSVLQLQEIERPICDCSELPGNTSSGIYQIISNNDGSTVSVGCEIGGWTVVGRRFDGSVNFNRVWQDYKIGFGNISGEFWLGNEILYQITSRAQYQVRFDLVDADGNTSYALYSTFGVDDETTNYTLNLDGYSGTAGNSMINYKSKSLNGMAFLTKDQDDVCPLRMKSGWWYRSCSQCNIFGLYGPGKKGVQFMIWKTWRGKVGLAKTTMMIKPYNPA